MSPSLEMAIWVLAGFVFICTVVPAACFLVNCVSKHFDKLAKEPVEVIITFPDGATSGFTTKYGNINLAQTGMLRIANKDGLVEVDPVHVVIRSIKKEEEKQWKTAHADAQTCIPF